MYKGALTVCLALLLAACSSTIQPVNCATAERDIKNLEIDKIYFISNFGGGLEAEIQEHIDQIKQTCGPSTDFSDIVEG